MSNMSQIDKRIADLEVEIATRQGWIDVLRSVKKLKPAKAPRKVRDKIGEANGTGVVRA